MNSGIPTTVPEPAMALYAACNDQRRAIKEIAAKVNALRDIPRAQFPSYGGAPEAGANITLAFRHLEDASMRLGKALQALDGGVSVYDKETTVGA